MKKRGISTIVATVLTVLISVVAVTIVWASVYPLLTNTIFSEDVNLRLVIYKQDGYTFYDKDNGYLSARVGRGSDDAELSYLKFIIDVSGESRVMKEYDVLGANQAKVYRFGIGFVDKVTSLKVVPVYRVGNKEVESSYFAYEENIPIKTTVVDDWNGVSCSLENEGSLSNGLVMYYSFDDNSLEKNVFDYSCNGHNGVAVENADYFDDSDRGSVFSFDGDGDYVDFARRAGLAEETGGSKTIAFWAKPGCKAIGSPPFENKNSILFGSMINYYIAIYDVCGSGDSIKFYYINLGGATRSFSMAGIDETNWHYYVLIFNVEENSVSLDIYVNEEGGMENVYSNTQNEEYGIVDSNFYFGTNGANPVANSFNGLIDEFRIYNRVLEVDEIQRLYEESGGE